MIALRKLLMDNAPADALQALHNSGELSEFLPELENLDIHDDHSHKHKNNFLHSLQVLRQAIAMESAPDLVLRTAALLHDIGKVDTRDFTEAGDPTFTLHELVGARQAAKLLRDHGYSKDEIEAIRELITNHMRAFNFDENQWGDSAVRRLIADSSTELQLRRLFVIFKADLTTKNKTKRDAIRANLDRLQARVLQVKEADALAKRRPAIDGHRLMAEFNLQQGRELGAVMKFLNSEEGLKLSEAEALEKAREILGR